MRVAMQRAMKFYPVEVDYGADDEHVQEVMGKTVKPGERRYGVTIATKGPLQI